jgi:hypothetical protein
VKKVLIAAALAAALIGSLWSLALPGSQLRDNINTFVFSERKTTDSASIFVGGAGDLKQDTITGPRARCDFSRRIVFRVSNQHMMTKDGIAQGGLITYSQACSLAVIQVNNKDSSDASGNPVSPYLGWQDANGLAGSSVIDNLSSQAFGESLGFRAIELAAPGSGRIPWKWARLVILLKAGGAGFIYGLKIQSISTDD